MSKYNATAVQLYVYDGAPATKKLIAEQTKCTLKLTRGTIDVTSKQNPDWDDFLTGKVSGELTVEFFDESELVPAEVNGNKLEEIFYAGTRPKWTLESTIVGTTNREFYAAILSLDLNRDQETGAAGTMTMKIAAKPTNTLVV